MHSPNGNGSTGGKIQIDFAFNLEQDRNVGRKGECIIAVVAQRSGSLHNQKKMYLSKIYMEKAKKTKINNRKFFLYPYKKINVD